VKSLRVCIITTVHSAQDPRIFYKQARSLAAAGFRVLMIAPHDRDYTANGIKICALPQERRRLYRMVRVVSRAARLALSEQADVYHLHDPELLPFAPLLKLFNRCTIIYDVHEDVRQQIRSKEWIPSLLRRPLSLLYSLVEKISLLFVDHVILAEDSYASSYGSKKAVVVRNYPLLGFDALPTDQLVAPASVLQTLALLLGRGHTRVQLIVVGPIYPPSLLEDINRCIESLGLIDRVQLYGKTRYPDALGIMRHGHIGLALLQPHPNYVCSVPTKLFEYMSFGLPVVVSDFPLWAEIVSSERCGLAVNPLAPNEAADAIDWLLRNPTVMRRMGCKGRRAIITKYNWQRENRRLLDVYRSITLARSLKNPRRDNR